MIYLTLPYFYENLQFYNTLRRYLTQFKKQKQEIFTFDFEIEFIQGSFPFSYWNGGINSNYNINGKLPIYKDYAQIAETASIPILLDFSNMNLKDFDVYDRHLNTILDIFKNRGIYLEVINSPFYTDIQKKYPNYKFILSKNNQTVSNLDDFCLIQILPSKFSDEDLLKITNKKNYQIILAEKPNYLELLPSENLSQITFSSESYFQDFKYFNSMQLALQLKKYADMGFTHFSIDAPPVKHLDDFNHQLLYFLVNPDYWNNIREESGM